MAWLHVLLGGRGHTTRPSSQPWLPAVWRRRLGCAYARNVAAVILICGLTALACTPKQPTVVPQIARVLWVGPTGLRLAVEVDVHNPNSFSLMVDAVEGVLELGNSSVLGQGLAYPRGQIPARGAARMTTQIDIQWLNMKALAPFLLGAGPVPYLFRGRARLGGDGLYLTVPFEVTGELTRAELMNAGWRGL